jgi:hypothetical protein
MKYGGDGWLAKTRLDDIARNIKIRSRSGFEGLYLRTFEAPAEFKPRRGVVYISIFMVVDGQSGELTAKMKFFFELQNEQDTRLLVLNTD